MKKPIEGLTPAYWDDVRKFSDKLLSNVEAKYFDAFPFRSTVWKSDWWSESANRAILEKGIGPKTGFLALLGATDTYHHLTIKGDISPKGGRESYRIQYDPDVEVVSRAGPAAELNLSQSVTLVDTFRTKREHRIEIARLEADGHYKVHLEDYELLHRELQWGVSKIGE